MATTLTLQARGPLSEVIPEVQQTLATARLAIETVIIDYGDDDGAKEAEQGELAF